MLGPDFRTRVPMGRMFRGPVDPKAFAFSPYIKKGPTCSAQHTLSFLPLNLEYLLRRYENLSCIPSQLTGYVARIFLGRRGANV